MIDHESFMREALTEAKLAAQVGEVPVGAVIVLNDKIVGRGRNHKEERTDPTSHAEIEAIKDACRNTSDWRLNAATIYVTAEPCVMCCGAIIHARIGRVIFGVTEKKFGGVISNASILDIRTFNHRTEWLSGILADEIDVVMKDFFAKLRK